MKNLFWYRASNTPNNVVTFLRGVLPVVYPVTNRGYAMSTRSKNAACVGRRRRMSAITVGSSFAVLPCATTARKAGLAIRLKGWGGDLLDTSIGAR